MVSVNRVTRQKPQVVWRVIYAVSRLSYRVAMACVVVLMLLTVADTGLRYLFNRPMLGAYEATELLLVLMVALGVAEVLVQRGHVAVDFVVTRLSQRAQGVIGAITSLICLCLFATLSWQTGVQARLAWLRSYETGVMYVPTAPFLGILAFGFGLTALILLIDCVSFTIRSLEIR